MFDRDEKPSRPAYLAAQGTFADCDSDVQDCRTGRSAISATEAGDIDALSAVDDESL
jgi:hypothetical protein